MKKLISLCCVLSLMLGLALSAPVTAVEADTGDEVRYTADLSNGLPEDWKLFEGCDVGHSNATAGTSGVQLSHSNSSINASLYHGAVYEIATDVGSVTDFDISMEFRFLSYDNDSRWIALMYHTKVSGSDLEGYLMNIRVNGTSAQSTVTAAPSFTDTTNLATGAAPSDKQVHTMRVTCKDGQVAHYFDGELIYSYSLNDKYGILGGVNNEGGFAICVNRSAIEITSLTLTGTKGEDNAVKSTVDTTLAQTYIPVTRLVAAPSVIADVDSAQMLKALTSQTVLPQNAVFTVNDELKVVDASGNVLGALEEVLTSELRERVTPVIRVSTEKQAQKLVPWLQQTNILDVAILSEDAGLLQYIRKVDSNVRAIWDCTAKELAMAQIVAQANESGASVVVLNDEMAATENVTYLQARLKTVWVKTQANTELAVADLISSGAYGIWAEDFALVYETYKNYADLNAMSRVPFNIAHRGLCLSSYENTVEGCLEAYENGATHMEIDLKLTSDGHIVIMHDDDISRTTNGSGKVANMTLAQLRKYKVTKNYNGEVIGEGVNIPTLEEFFEEFCDKDVILVLELKTSDAALVTKLKQLLEQWPEMTEKIIVIAFSVDQLATMYAELPQIPTANLNTYTYNDFANGLITSGTYNTVPDTGYGNVSDYFVANEMLVRGYMAYCWTYGSKAEVANYFGSGVLGMTNNVADVYKDLVCAVGSEGKYLIGSADDTIFDAVVTTYSGESQAVQAKVFLTEEREDGTYVILKYRYNVEGSESLAYTVYSRAIKVINAQIYLSPAQIVEELNDLPAELSLADKETVEHLRAAYDALDAEDQALVTNVSILIGAEKTISRLEK